MCGCAHVREFARVRALASARVRSCTRVGVPMRARKCVRTYICVLMYACEWVFARVFALVYMRLRANVCLCARVLAFACKCVRFCRECVRLCASVCVCARMREFSFVHALTRGRCTCVCLCGRVSARACVCAFFYAGPVLNNTHQGAQQCHVMTIRQI